MPTRATFHTRTTISVRLVQRGPWRPVLSIPGVVQTVYVRCMKGLCVNSGQHTGFAIKQPSSMTASCHDLTFYFEGQRCDQRHEHIPNTGALGKISEYSNAEAWIWKEATSVIDCIRRCMKHERLGISAYPIDITKIARAQKGSAPRPGRDPRAPPQKGSPCKACRGFKARNDWEHNRVIGEC